MAMSTTTTTTTSTAAATALLPNQNQIRNFTITPKKSLFNLDPLSLKSPSYTSLKEVLPFSAAVNSPTASSGGHHICIRNRLVKQAAWAYLQPMSTSPSGPSSPQFFRRSFNPLAACLGFICNHLVPCFTRILHAIRTQVPIPCFFA